MGRLCLFVIEEKKLLTGHLSKISYQELRMPAARSRRRMHCSTQAGQVPPSHHHNQMFSVEPYPTAEGR
jgi:hypothetical protein